MVRAISVLVIGFAVAIQGYPVAAQDQEEESTKIVATGEWPPLSSEAFFAPYTSYGRAADVVDSAFREAGIETQIEFHSFGDAYALASEAKVDAAFPYYRTTEREKQTIFSAPLLEVTEILYYDKKHAPYLGEVRSEADMEKVLEERGGELQKSARFVESYCYHEDVEKHFPRDCTNREDRDLETDIDAFKALANDRKVLILPSAKEVGDRILHTWFREEERDRIGIIAGLEWPRKVFLVAPKGQAGDDLIKAFDLGLERIQETGQYEQLVNAPLPEESVLRTVRLSDPGTFPLIVARKTKDSEETVVLPRGTDAMVVQWSRNFLTPQKTTLQEQLNQMSRVMIMNGPQRGQLLWVKNVFIELDGSPRQHSTETPTETPTEDSAVVP